MPIDSHPILVYNEDTDGGGKMLSFGKVLEFLMKQHECRAVDLCAKLDLSKSYFSRLVSGKISPRDFALVESLSGAMELPAHEKQMLVDAYKATKFGEEFIAEERAVKRLYDIEFPHSGRKLKPPETTLCSGCAIEGMARTAAAIRSLMAEEGTAYFVFIPENQQFCDLLRQDAAERKAEVKWLIYLNGETDRSAENMSIFTETISLLLAGNADVRYNYKDVGEYYSSTPFPYMLITNSGTLLLDRNCERAFFWDSAEFSAVYRDFIIERFEKAYPFVRLMTGLEEYLQNWRGMLPGEKGMKDDLLIVEKWPCIIHEAEYSDISSHIADGEQNDRLARAYTNFMRWSNERLRTQEMIFTEEGVQEFLKMEKFYEYSRHITKPLPMGLRRIFLQKLIENCQSNAFNPAIMRDAPFLDSNVRVVNVWKSGIVLIVFDFEECFRVAVLQEKTISGALWDYFRKLKECGMVISKGETVGILKEVLDRKI